MIKHKIIVTKTLDERDQLQEIIDFLNSKKISFGLYKIKGVGYHIRRKADDNDKKIKFVRKTYAHVYKEKMKGEKLIEEYKEGKRCL